MPELQLSGIYLSLMSSCQHSVSYLKLKSKNNQTILTKALLPLLNPYLKVNHHPQSHTSQDPGTYTHFFFSMFSSLKWAQLYYGFSLPNRFAIGQLLPTRLVPVTVSAQTQFFSLRPPRCASTSFSTTNLSLANTFKTDNCLHTENS